MRVRAARGSATTKDRTFQPTCPDYSIGSRHGATLNDLPRKQRNEDCRISLSNRQQAAIEDERARMDDHGEPFVAKLLLAHFFALETYPRCQARSSR
jgi:hypothetical protein